MDSVAKPTAIDTMDDASVSAYEAKRLQRIQQNKQLLQSLGIEIQKKAPVKRVLVPREVTERRRSSRLQLQDQNPVQNDEIIATLLTLDDVRKTRRVRPRITEPKPLHLPVVDVAPQVTGPKRQHLSSMEIPIDVATFHDRWLGKQIWPKGKDTVMQGMCPPTHVASFSKMSGVQRWQNAVVLFVNVLGASGYENVFTEVTTTTPPAVHFKWFAQGRHHEESPVIVRLKNAQRGHSSLWLEGSSPPPPPTADTQTPEPVLLFIRHADGPYIYCGRLGYLGHFPDSSPLEFRLQLLDVGALDWHKVKPLLDDPTTQTDDAVIQSENVV